MTKDFRLMYLPKKVKNIKQYVFSGRTGRLLIEQGYSDEFVQVLMGHASMKMTEHYLEDGKIEWIQAEAGLSLPKPILRNSESN